HTRFSRDCRSDVCPSDLVTLPLDGSETFDISGLADQLVPQKILQVRATHPSGKVTEFNVKARMDSPIEIEYFKHNGILQYVLREIGRASCRERGAYLVTS